MAESSSEDSSYSWEDLSQLLQDQQELISEYQDISTELSAYLQIASRRQLSDQELQTFSEIISDAAMEWERIGSEKEWVDETVDRIIDSTVRKMIQEAEDELNDSDPTA